MNGEKRRNPLIIFAGLETIYSSSSHTDSDHQALIFGKKVRVVCVLLAVDGWGSVVVPIAVLVSMREETLAGITGKDKTVVVIACRVLSVTVTVSIVVVVQLLAGGKLKRNRLSQSLRCR